MNLKLLLFSMSLVLMYKSAICVISRRSLIFPRPSGKVQTIVGAGIPLVLRDESIIVGLVFKASYGLPTNSSYVTNPSFPTVKRKKRTAISRWNLYKLLEEFLTLYDLGGKECVLRSVCEWASTPVEHSSLISEIFHVIFNPTTTNDELNHYSDNEYLSAHRIGLQEKNRCDLIFPDCLKNFLDLFTKIV